MPPPPTSAYQLDDFEFALPDELIAQHPAPERSASRLLDVRDAVQPCDRRFQELPALLDPGDLLVFNDTRVIKARLRGTKTSGGAVEVMVERIRAEREVLAQLRASKAPRPGTLLRLGDAFDAEVLGREGEFYRLRFPADPLMLLERHGHVPLPPYIRHADDIADERRYQTVFARHPGAVAAPTAALHFDAALLAALRERGIEFAHVTLHVGAGTFQPVRSANLAEHRMHSEWFEVNEAAVAAIARARARRGRVVAVGTTTLRALESAALEAGESRVPLPCRRETDIFITPGFRFRVVDALVTNFHLPRSTLMMLVSAFAGMETIRRAYAHAIAQRYRFFSYGDAMLLARA
jgi:S-adenosylmethionine:tRNA ribosyltransferase-isomerase